VKGRKLNRKDKRDITLCTYLGGEKRGSLVLGREGSFIEDNMHRQIYFVSNRIQTFITRMMVTKEDTWFRSIFKFMQPIRSKKKVTKTLKDTKFLIIWPTVVKLKKWRQVLQGKGRQPIDDMHSSDEGINPIMI
jgi:carbamate kinase